MEASTAKLISMLTLGLGSFLCGILPAFFSEAARKRHPLLLSCLLCFGGGVLLSTSLAHMLPEARERLPESSELMLCLGFFLVYLVDELVHLLRGRSELRSYGSSETSPLCDDGECREPSRGFRRGSSSGVVGLLCALLVHSVLEGLAIGLQETSSQVLLLLAAVSSHKFVVGFCLGGELCASFPRRACAHLACVALFSGGSVIGIAVGAGLDTVTLLKDSTAVPIMQALAAGTLLYVTVSEVLPREKTRWHDRKRTAGLAQFAAVAVGFTSMYLTTKYLDHDEA